LSTSSGSADHPAAAVLRRTLAASPQLVTMLLAVYSLMAMIAAPLWGRLSDRIGRRPVLMASMLAAALAYLWLGLASSLWMLFAARALAGVCAGNIAAAQAYVADVTPPSGEPAVWE